MDRERDRNKRQSHPTSFQKIEERYLLGWMTGEKGTFSSFFIFQKSLPSEILQLPLHLWNSKGTSDPVERRYSIGSFPLTSFISMTQTHLLFSIASLAVTPPLTSALLHLCRLVLRLGGASGSGFRSPTNYVLLRCAGYHLFCLGCNGNSPFF